MQFHYDKDEAAMKKKQTLKFPLLSTVTYLTSVGAPTIVINETATDVAPPTGAMLSYPKANRHLVFRGDLEAWGGWGTGVGE